VAQGVGEFVLARALPHQAVMPTDLRPRRAKIGTSEDTQVNRDRQLDDLVRRVKAEYLEMPGLRLTAVQARRFWSLDDRTCSAVLAALIADHFLARTETGSYRRFDSA
jgi:hypothetical protein